MAFLTIHREKERVNRWHKYYILLDGKQVCILANGESKRIEVPEGPHTIYGIVNWHRTSTLSFELKSDEEIQLNIHGSLYANLMEWIIFGLIISPNGFLSTPNKYYYILFEVIAIVFLLWYYRTSVKKRYLTLLKLEVVH
ncbi:MAG: hypothetical protein KGM98_04440 [Bacteroidota bacterium]|nr:hypothetical protein [Bacteroidota bacterium]